MKKIIIYIEKGQIMSVMTNSELGELKVYVVDADIQGINEKLLLTITHTPDISYKALCYAGMADIDDADTNRLTDLIDEHLTKLENER